MSAERIRPTRAEVEPAFRLPTAEKITDPALRKLLTRPLGNAIYIVRLNNRMAEASGVNAELPKTPEINSDKILTDRLVAIREVALHGAKGNLTSSKDPHAAAQIDLVLSVIDPSANKDLDTSHLWNLAMEGQYRTHARRGDPSNIEPVTASASLAAIRVAFSSEVIAREVNTRDENFHQPPNQFLRGAFREELAADLKGTTNDNAFRELTGDLVAVNSGFGQHTEQDIIDATRIARNLAIAFPNRKGELPIQGQMFDVLKTAYEHARVGILVKGEPKDLETTARDNLRAAVELAATTKELFPNRYDDLRVSSEFVAEANKLKEQMVTSATIYGDKKILIEAGQLARNLQVIKIDEPEDKTRVVRKTPVSPSPAAGATAPTPSPAPALVK